MFPLKAVPCLYYIIVILCQISCTVGDIKSNKFNDGKIEETELNDVPSSSVLDEKWNDKHVQFVTLNVLEGTEEEIFRVPSYEQLKERDFLGNWILKNLNNNENVRIINEPSNKKRIPRQSNAGYFPLYPTLPTNGSHTNYGSYNFNNISNSRQPTSHGLNTTTPNYYYSNISRPGNLNVTLSGPNPYRYNFQYPTHSSANYNYSHYNNSFKPEGMNGMYQYNRSTPNYNNNGNSYRPQPVSRPTYPGATNNGTNIPIYPQPSNRPISPVSNNHTFLGYFKPNGTTNYPGVLNNNPTYPPPTSRPIYSGATNNGTNFGYPQPNSRPSYPGMTNFGSNPNYPQYPNRTLSQMSNNYTYPGYSHPTNRPFYPEATVNRTSPTYPQSRPFYPGHFFNGTNPSYPQQPSRPSGSNYPSSSNPIRYNSSMVLFNNIYNNRSTPKLPSSSPYSPPTGYYTTRNPNGSFQGTTPGSQQFSNNSRPYSSGIREWQGYGPNALNSPPSHSTLSNSYWKNPQHSQYNYTNGYTPLPTSQHFGNNPNSSYSQNSNSYSGTPNFSLNHNNAGFENKNMFYPAPNREPNYDPRKNPPNQFSYNH